MSSYVTRMGDTLSFICHRFYGTTKGGVVEAVLEANPKLSNYPPVLPAAITITLPEVAAPATEEQLISLWD